MHLYRSTNSKSIHIFRLEKFITIYLVYICCNFFYKYFFHQVDNLNLATNLKIHCFYVMLITCKCTSLCKKLDYDVKREPCYLATTLIGMLT
jgi:tryptophan-rich sensory protein